MTTSKRYQPATDDSPPAPCIECKTSLGNRDDCVQCSACGSWTCIACLMGCTKAVTETKKKDASRVLGCAGVVYTCKKCQESSDPVTADSYAALLKIVTANSQQIASLSEMIANLTIQVAAQKVVGNQRQLQQQQQQQPFDMVQVVLAASQAASETIMEQMELKEKKSNLVCVGWKEDTTLALDNEQNERDRVIIDHLCDQLRIKKELVVKNFRDGPKHYHRSHDRKTSVLSRGPTEPQNGLLPISAIFPKVLYTHQIRRRKTRVWQDGFLRLSSVGTKAVLLDSRSCQLDTLHVKPSQLTIGSELESDRFLVTLEEERLSEPLLSPCTTSEIANRVTNQCDQKQVPTSQIFQPPRQAYSKQPPHVSPSSSVGLLPRVDAKSEQNNRPEGPVKYSAGAPCDLRRNRAEILALLEPRYSELQNNMAVSSGSSLDLHLPFVTDCEDSALRHNSSKQDTGSLGYGIQGKVERNSGKEVKLNRNGFDNGVEFGSLSLSSDFDLSSNLDLTFGDPNSQAATGGSYQFDSLFENAKSLGAENGFDEKQVSGKSRNLRENVEAEIQNESEMMDGRQNVLQDKQNRDGWGNNVKTDSLEESADDLQLGGSMNVWKMVHQNKLKNVDNGDNDKCGKMEEKEASLQPNKVTNENEIDGCSNLGQIADGKFDEDCDMDQKWDDLDNLELLGLDVIEEKVEKIFCEEIDDMKHDSLEELREDIENGETRPIASVEDVFADDVGRIRSEFHAREGECISQHTAPRRDFGMMMHANNDPMVSEKRLALQCMHDAAAADFEDLTTLQTPRREGDFCDIPTLPTVTSTQLSQHGTSNPDFHPLQSDPCSTPVQVVMTAVPPRAPFEVREGDRILPMVPRVSRPVCKSSRWSKYQKPCDDLTFEIGQFDRDMREPRLVKEQNSEAANQNEQDFNSEPESVLSKCYADDCHEQWTLQENTKPVALKQKTLEMGRFLLDDKHLGLISGNNKMPEGTITKTSMSKEMITGSKLDPGMMRKVKQTPPMTFRKSRIIDMGEENEYSTLTGVTTASPSPQENFEVPWLIEMEVEEAKKDLKRRETRRPGGLRRRLGLAPLVGCQKPQSVVGGDLQRGRDGLRGCGGDSRGGRGRGRSEGSQTLRSELCFPSSGVALTVSRGSALREYSIPLSFFSVSSYRNALSLAITEHLNLLLLDAAHCYHRNLRSQLGSTPTPSHCAPSSVLQSGNVVLYKNCYLFNRRRARRGCKEEPIKALLFLHLSARRPHSAYNKDDLWVVSRDGLFAAKTTFIACSSFYGPSADGELELTPLHGYSPSEWTENVTVFALWVCNISNELSCLRNISANLAHGSPPILHALLNPPSRATAVVHAVRPGFRPPRQCSGQSATLDAKHLASELEQIERRLGLNAEQTAALRQVSAMVSGHSAQSVTLIQGVFGAGKSFLLAVIVCFLSRVFKAAGPRPGNSPWRVLVSAATNMAVDGVLLGLLQQGFTEFVRVGSIKKIVKAILPYSLHAGQGSEPGELVTMLREAVSPAERALLRRALEVQRLGRNKKLLSQVSVVGVTCAASPFSCLDHMSFPVVVLDEASQMTEPTSLLPLARFGCEKLILVGDPKQLAPTISGSESHHGNGLEQTLFNRLRLLGHEPVFLSTQYRCHPTIGQLSGSLFYDRHLRNGVTATERSPAVHWLPTLALYNVSGQEQLTRDGSWQNDAETKLVVKLVEALVDDGVPGSHIGVITPYRAQVKQISNHLVSVLAYCPDMARSVLVSTVDAFQGGERDAVIVSCVRTCVQGARDETRRVTVALTRAKRHLAIIACIAGLKPSPLWGKVIQYCQDISCVHDASDIFSTLDRIIESRGSWKPGEEIRPEENWEKPKESLEKPEESLEKLEKSLEKLEESLEKPECISRKARGKEHLAQEPERQHKWRKRKKDKGVFQVEKRLKGSKSKAVLASRPCFLPSDAESIEQQGTITC